MLDLVLATTALLLLSPFFLFACLMIRLTSPGPALYPQSRVGQGGRPFTLLKFRTMVQNAEQIGAGILCLKDDPRITPIGRLLRALSLDELPQLINILKGEMSLIGPRPGLDYQYRQYTPVQRKRLDVLPGITGWAQVNGRNSIPWDRRIELDVEYVDNLSFLLDLRILSRTLRTVLRREDMIAHKDYFKEKAARQNEQS
jgi:undecaprenyl phosphate N,N'-diacetylbacillosamine 1-phosphate transferase